MLVGSGAFRYQESRDWARLPAEWEPADFPGVAVDSRDNLFVLTRGASPVLVFGPGGEQLAAWAQGPIVAPHGIGIGPDDTVYIVDDLGHALHLFRPGGELIRTIASQRARDERDQVRQVRSVAAAGAPFNMPTGVARGPEGQLYVSDGYGNARVHVFDEQGQLLFGWGEPGTGPGQFNLPHGIWIDGDLVYVSDRMNRRVQLFDLEGAPRGAWEELRWPNNIAIDGAGVVYVAELGARWLDGREGDLTQPAARISLRDRSGGLLASWEYDAGEGIYAAPHGIAVDSRGDLYVSEVSHAYCRGAAPRELPLLRKYTRLHDD
jgi:DNA-binding beta-propeller fold protein YncE